MRSDNPHVLVVSHNVFSASGNMGKTMMHMLAGIPADMLAQLYFHQEIPTRRCCLNYFRITDSDILQSVFTRKARYRIFTEEDIDESVTVSRTDSGSLAKVYQFSRRRTPLIYIMRNAMWSAGRWKTDALLEWARSFAPDVIFLAAGDYEFPYRIALWVSERLNIPIVMWCADDFYITPQKSSSVLRRIQCRRLLTLARRVVDRSGRIITISDAMQRDYTRLFGSRAETIRISCGINQYVQPADKRSGIVYIGNLGVNRITPLAELGRVLKSARIPGCETMRVYSGEQNPEIICQINEGNGMSYCGRASAQEVDRILGESKFLVLVEAFDDKSLSRTRYSLSTKVAESLRSGACIIAYGPPEAASIGYLRQYDAACILGSADELPEALMRLCTDKEEYARYVDAAGDLAGRLHDPEINERAVVNVLMDAINNKLK